MKKCVTPYVISIDGTTTLRELQSVRNRMIERVSRSFSPSVVFFELSQNFIPTVDDLVQEQDDDL